MKTDSFSYQWQAWLIEHWSRATLLMAAVLLLLSPLFFKKSGVLLFLVFIQLPLYLFHQYEEHAKGKFKLYVHHTLGKDVDILSDTDIFLINLFLVWVLNLVVLYLAAFVNVKLGLIAGYLSLLNGASHVGMGMIRQEYNPGLWTSLFLLAPGGGILIYSYHQYLNLNLAAHGTAIWVVVLGHGLIILRVLLNLRNYHKLNNKE